jgi:hypothetical protein
LPHAKTTRRHTGSLRQKDNESDSDEKKYSPKRPLALPNLKYLLLYQQETFKFCSLLENLQMMKIFMIKIFIFTFFYLRLEKVWLFFKLKRFGGKLGILLQQKELSRGLVLEQKGQNGEIYFRYGLYT